MTRIAVTGASGYIGRHVIKCINDNDCNAISIVHPASEITDQVDCRALDILNANKDDIKKAFDNVDAVIHLAWQSGFNHHDESHLKNVSLHLEFIENLMASGVKNISIAGTMHEIGYHVGEIDENTPCNPINPYGIAKNYLRQASIYLASKYNVNLKWLRMYYILGDDLRSNSIFSKIIKASNEGKQTFPLNSGEMLYDFINVDDLALQIFQASKQNIINGIIECCSGKPVSLRTTVEKFIKDNNLIIRPEYNVFPAREYDSHAIWGSSKVINQILNDV